MVLIRREIENAGMLDLLAAAKKVLRSFRIMKVLLSSGKWLGDGSLGIFGLDLLLAYIWHRFQCYLRLAL